MEDAISFSKTIKDKDMSLSYRQLLIKCEEVLEKSAIKLELIEGFEREKCNQLFNLAKNKK